MSFRARCPHCQKHVTAPDNALGRTLRCPHCQAEFEVAREPEKADALPATSTSKEPQPCAIWEYRIEDLMEPVATGGGSQKSAAEVRQALRAPIEKRINTLGAEGWELAAATYVPAESHGLTEAIGFWKMIFKRPKRTA